MQLSDKITLIYKLPSLMSPDPHPIQVDPADHATNKQIFRHTWRDLLQQSFLLSKTPTSHEPYTAWHLALHKTNTLAKMSRVFSANFKYTSSIHFSQVSCGDSKVHKYQGFSLKYFKCEAA